MDAQSTSIGNISNASTPAGADRHQTLNVQGREAGTVGNASDSLLHHDCADIWVPKIQRGQACTNAAPPHTLVRQSRRLHAALVAQSPHRPTTS